ncbi:MAG: hypothetical protein E7015_01910 [Alphaproteobacteria bacterium]|nr:hypothetical protein [Alphaproteobacteria bacterium]
MSNIIKILSLLLVLVPCFSELNSMQIVPFVYTWVVEDENTFQYHITNTSDSLLAFELGLWIRLQDKNGKDILMSIKELKELRNRFRNNGRICLYDKNGKIIFVDVQEVKKLQNNQKGDVKIRLQRKNGGDLFLSVSEWKSLTSDPKGGWVCLHGDGEEKVFIHAKELMKIKDDSRAAEKYKLFANFEWLCNCIDIYPKQIIIPPKTQRSIKLRFHGKIPDREIAMRVSFSQFGISTAKKAQRTQKNASVNVKYEIWSSLYITPKNAKPKVRVVSVNEQSIVLHNDGNTRQEIRQSDLVCEGKSIKELISKEDLDTVIMSGNDRVYMRKKAESRSSSNDKTSKR